MEKKIPACDQGGRAAIQAQVQEITRDLLHELGNASAIEGVRGSARLDEDLGLESIERAELMARLNRVLGTSLPESAIAEARTLDDIVTAIAGSSGTEAGSAPGGPTAGAAAEPFHETERNSAGTASAARQAARSSAGLIRTALETVYGIYAAGVFIVWLVLAWLLLKLMPSGQPAARMTSVALRIYFRLVGCRLRSDRRREYRGPQRVDLRQQSYELCDVLVVMALFGTNYHFVAKSEINDMPFIGSFLRKIGHFSFERGKIRARSRQVEQMEKALLRGESVFVFAEGTLPPSRECVLFTWGRSARPSKREGRSYPWR